MILTWDNMCTSGMMRDLCPDLMESWSWILTFPTISVVILPDLCSQLVRTTSLNYNCDKVESKEEGLRMDEVENKDLRER